MLALACQGFKVAGVRPVQDYQLKPERAPQLCDLRPEGLHAFSDLSAKKRCGPAALMFLWARQFGSAVPTSVLEHCVSDQVVSDFFGIPHSCLQALE